MNLVTRHPFALINELQRDMNRLFDNRVFPGMSNEGGNLSNIDWQPAVDIHEDNEGYHLCVDLPGIAPSAVEVTAHNNVLSIRGNRSEVHTDKEQKRSERIFGTFRREFSMPDNADLDNISAKCDNGVLNILVPKSAKAEPKRISVQ